MDLYKNVNFNVELTPYKEETPHVSYSRLEATAVCPTNGALLYTGERDDAVPRQTPLDAGRACHDVFAARRLWEVLLIDDELGMREGIRLFGKERFDLMLTRRDEKKDEPRMAMLAFCLEALYTAGYYDDPYDTTRTLAALEQTCVSYCDAYDPNRRVYIDKDMVGIELALDMLITGDDGWSTVYRMVLDGIHTSRLDDNKVLVGENKTGRYINDAWADTFLMSHQITGYCLGASLLTGEAVNDAIIFGSQIPVKVDLPIRTEHVSRESHHYQQFLRWVRWTADMFESAHADPINAPKFTHSCGRFFRKCQFLPFCTADDESKELYLTRVKKES